MSFSQEDRRRDLLALIRAAFAEADEIGKEADELLVEVSAMSEADLKAYALHRNLPTDQLPELPSDTPEAPNSALTPRPRLTFLTGRSAPKQNARGHHRVLLAADSGDTSDENISLPTRPEAFAKLDYPGGEGVVFHDDGRAVYMVFTLMTVPKTLRLGTEAFALVQESDGSELWRADGLDPATALRYLANHRRVPDRYPLSWT